MTPKQRVAAAMRHEPHDRVPVMSQLALGHYFLHCGPAPADIWFDGETFAAALVDRQRAYGFDGLLVNLPGRPRNWREHIRRREREGQGERLVWDDGLETIVPPDDNPQTYGPGGAPPDRADPQTVDPQDPRTYRLSGYLWNTWHVPALWGIDPDADLGDPAAYPPWYTETLRAARRLAPDVSVHAEVFSPFTHLMELFGYERALMALIDVPETCHRLLEVFAAQGRAQAGLYAACRPDAILVSSAFAGGGFISRSMYEQFVLPYEKQLAEAIHQAGIVAYVHTCGAIGDRLDLMARTGTDGIDTLDPPPLGNVNLSEAVEKFGDAFFFKGNLDPVHELLKADEETFTEAVAQRLAIARRTLGYILSSACSVSPHVRPERLAKLVRIAERDGVLE